MPAPSSAFPTSRSRRTWYSTAAWGEPMSKAIASARPAPMAAARPRPGKFDSSLTECGPPAIITDKGIELYYNGRNATDDKADPALPKGMYSVGRMIFDKNDPEKLIDRLDNYFLKPDLPHEITGQYKAGTTFAEALIYFKEKWFLYYGTADSFVGLAISE